VGILEGLGHQACEVSQQMPGSTRDEIVIEYAKKHGLILLTCDFDFADIRNYPVGSSPGIVVVHVPDSCGAKAISQLVRSALVNQELLDQLPKSLVILEPGRVRVKKA